MSNRKLALAVCCFMAIILAILNEFQNSAIFGAAGMIILSREDGDTMISCRQKSCQMKNWILTGADAIHVSMRRNSMHKTDGHSSVAHTNLTMEDGFAR